MSQIEATASRIPYMVEIGNHECDHVTGGDKDPSEEQGDGGFQPICFDIGPVHLVYYSTEHNFHRLSPQYVWLEQDLPSVDRIRTLWLIVASHRPMYSSLVGIDLSKVMLQLYIEALLYNYHVDLNLFAHIHSYERTCPTYQYTCIDDGITQVLIDIGGHDLTYGSYTGTQ
ncbi:unnamed protein product [Rotaria sp. Silwood1]|nr:unnamed protein product [Rotaria sp. Silwood1]